MVKGSGSETVDSVQAGTEECLTVSNRDIVHVTGIIVYNKQTGALEKMRKATISFVTSVCLSFLCASVSQSVSQSVS
jgi:hypothetical protein